ncbi:MAG: hypothetical protein HC827_04560, partial [Cyanobacteria bacterium RM1_2_2]|nr:hypothetical protein [Cyanobacteria bacterium RM1_2_2]
GFSTALNPPFDCAQPTRSTALNPLFDCEPTVRLRTHCLTGLNRSNAEGWRVERSQNASDRSFCPPP